MPKPTFETYKLAVALILSRAFHRADGYPYLLPSADLFNSKLDNCTNFNYFFCELIIHLFISAVNVLVASEDDDITLLATADVPEGEQLFSNYGIMSNAEYLRY